jgi:hypothetical protein
MLRRLRGWIAARRMRRRIASLSAAEREALLQSSPLDLGLFQGEGYHVFRKDEPDMNRAYVCSLGEIAPRDAEDWIIARALEAADAAKR